MAAGAEAVAHVVEAVPDVDALFCGGGLLAAGAFFECQKRGWSMPGRIAIASFDDIEMLRHLSPMVTTLRLPRHDIGVRSAQMLLSRILDRADHLRSEEHTSELQSLMRISYAVFCLKKKKKELEEQHNNTTRPATRG